MAIVDPSAFEVESKVSGRRHKILRHAMSDLLPSPSVGHSASAVCGGVSRNLHHTHVLEVRKDLGSDDT